MMMMVIMMAMIVMTQTVLEIRAECQDPVDCGSCYPGYYMTENCCRLPGEGVQGTMCKPCTKCEGELEVVKKPCSASSDTVCGCVDGAQLNQTKFCVRNPSGPSYPRIYVPPKHIRLLCIISVLAVACLLAVASTCLFQHLHRGPKDCGDFDVKTRLEMEKGCVHIEGCEHNPITLPLTEQRPVFCTRLLRNHKFWYDMLCQGQIFCHQQR